MAVPVDPPRALCAFIAPKRKAEKERTCNCGGAARKVLVVKWEEHVSTTRFMDERMEKIVWVYFVCYVLSIEMDME